MKQEVLEEQFRLLFDSIESISSAKNLSDKYDLQIDHLQAQIKNYIEESQKHEIYVNQTVYERDELRKVTLQLIESKEKLTADKHVI